MYKKPSLPKQFLIYIGMTVVALIFMFPLIWMIVSSFKDDAMIFSDITSLKAFAPAFKEDVFFNYKEVISKLPLVKAMLNSLSYIIVIIALGLIVNSMAGYAFARLKFPKKNLLFALILAVMIIPAQTVMLPQFSIIYKMGLSNSYLALILPRSQALCISSCSDRTLWEFLRVLKKLPSWTAPVRLEPFSSWSCLWQNRCMQLLVFLYLLPVGMILYGRLW